MKYDNTAHWKNLHKKYGNSLKTVGISGLSEEYNKLKYNSESDSLLRLMDSFKDDLLKQKKINVLDIGAGIGYWSELLFNYFKQNGGEPCITSLDISEDALSVIKQNNPGFNTLPADLKTIDINSHANGFNTVIACYCFHHLTGLLDYMNAVKFAAASVCKDGYLIIMDPILSKPYSEFYSVDYSTYSGHSFPRPLYLIDGLLLETGFKRTHVSNALSYILSCNMESRSRLGFYLQRKIWNFFYYFVYKSQKATKFISPLINSFDSMLKNSKYCNGTIIAVYKKC